MRHLLSMRAGIPDFDNARSRQYQLSHPQEDMGPVESMSFLFPVKDEDWYCDPGTCGVYSSSNYELLGLILAQAAGKQSWDEYTQAEDLPHLPEMTSTRFAIRGVCSKYTRVHAYSSEVSPPVDVYNFSCTNGWTCGNLISNAGDAAVFVRALLADKDRGGARVVSEKTRNEMIKMQKLGKKSWAIGLPYGLGLMDLGFESGREPGAFVGHGGETYGFNAFTGYDKPYDYGISVVANNENATMTVEVLTQASKAVIAYLTGSGSNKTQAPNSSIVIV